MRRLLVGALLGVLLVVSGCGGPRSQTDQDKDGKLLADAIRAAYRDGSTFKLDQQSLVTGGDLSGQARYLHGTVDSGVLKDDTARFIYRLQLQSGTALYDMVIAQDQLYVKVRSASSWKSTKLPLTTALYPALRLDLLRQTVLLSHSISTGSLTHIDAGFAHKYTVKPAPDQLEELESISVQGTTEDQFLKTATAQMDVYLMLPGNKLGHIDLQMTGTDPYNDEKRQILCTLDVKPAKVAAIQAPSDAQQVTPDQILT